MNLPNRTAGARGIPRQLKRPGGHAPQSKAGVAQSKTAVSAQSIKQPVAPPAYRPQATPKPGQPKIASGAVSRNPPVGPPVYRPQSKPANVQVKTARLSQVKNHPVAPPQHHAQRVPKVLQTKKTASEQVLERQHRLKPAAPVVQGLRQPSLIRSASRIPGHKPASQGHEIVRHKMTPTSSARTPSSFAGRAGLALRSSTIQREQMKIGTESGEGVLTYTTNGTIGGERGKYNGIILVFITIPPAERRKGYASKLLKAFLQMRVGFNACYLDVLPDATGGPGIQELEKWYAGFGFQTIDRSETGPIMMYKRQPLQAKVEQGGKGGSLVSSDYDSD